MVVFSEILTRNISKLYYATNNSRLANLECKTESKETSILTGVVEFTIKS